MYRLPFLVQRKQQICKWISSKWCSKAQQFDDSGENAPISVKGSNQSIENKDEKPPLLNLNLKTDNETGLLRKPRDLQNLSDNAVSLPTDLNLAESSCGTPETPITNWEYDMFKDNLQQSPEKTIKWELL